MGTTIRQAHPQDAEALGDALAEAFLDYAWSGWALGADNRLERLRGLYRLHAGLVSAEAGTTWLAEDDDDVVAAAAWVRPDAPPPSASTATLLEREVPRLLGDRGAAVAAAEAATEGLLPPGPTWFLACVGTRPAWRGRGIGGALVQAGLRAVDEHGHAAGLETSSEANVRLYLRVGFAVVAEVEPPGGAPHVWVMHRPPRPVPTPTG